MTLSLKASAQLVNELTDREANWIVAKLSNEGIHYIDDTEQNRNQLREWLCEDEGNYEHARHLQKQSDAYLLKDDELEWIERQDIRLMRWLIHCSNQPPTHLGLRSQFPHIDESDISESRYYDRFIDSLDDWKYPIRYKRRSIHILKSAWSEILRNERDLRWLHKDDADQIDWAWNFLNTHLDKHQNLRVRRYSPISPMETYFAIMSTFDTWATEDSGALYKLQSGMKQAWAQRKYRSTLAAKNKRQSSYVLSEKTKEQLKELAIERNINLNQMLEHIIREAYKNFKKGRS